jgi:hypothetical protein
MTSKGINKIFLSVSVVATIALIVCAFLLVQQKKAGMDTFFTGSSGDFVLSRSTVLWNDNGLKITAGLLRTESYLLNCQDDNPSFGCEHSQDDFEIVKMVDRNNETTFLVVQGDAGLHVDTVDADSASMSVFDSLGANRIGYKLNRVTHLLTVVK